MRIRKRRALAVFSSYLAVLGMGFWLTSLVSAGGAGGAAVGGGNRAGGRAGGNPNASTPVQNGPGAGAGRAPAATDPGLAFFESRIRPVLIKQCYSCHSADAKDLQAGLFLDSRQGIRRGGESGPAVVPGNVEASLLIKALRYTDKDLQMPPDGKLADSVIKDFESWVKMGAPDSRDAAAPTVAKTYDTEAAKKWWAFQPLKRPTTPTVADTAWPHGNIDRFVLAGLEAKQIKPVADADKMVLLRRITFDLIGLPPTPEEIEAFTQDSAPDAYTKVVDKLLASPQFGERWGRHWLDVARYAESSGKDVNITYPNAWRYRDYVIAAFNSDKPYDQFIKEQLAGDLLPSATPKQKAEHEIATGFLAIGPKSLSEQMPRQFELDLVDEQVAETAQAFMALTVGCARCHDHKFDPIMQRDYYAMVGIFASTRTMYGTLAGPRNLNDGDLIELPAAANAPTVQINLTAQARLQLQKDLTAALAEYEQLLAQRGRNAPQGLAQQIQQALGQTAHLQAQLDAYDAAGKPKAFCMGVQDRPPTIGRLSPMGAPATRRGPLNRPASGFESIADSPLFFRGEMSEPRDRVPRGVPVFLASGMSSIPATESGRRELANWIASPRNPLTARVMANRLWQWLEGQGIVASVDNFGTMGEAPANQALLDYLANRLIDNNWSLKKTIREIVLSRTYQLASTYNEQAFTADPQDALCWRHAPLRLDAECLRDAMLSTCGQLDLQPPASSMVAVAGDGAIAAGPAYMRINDTQFLNAAGAFRSVYLPAVRDLEPDALSVFDYPDSNTINGQRESTNVPAQALYLLNSDYVHAQALRMAQRLIAAVPGAITQPRVRTGRVNLAFELAFGRLPTAQEQATASEFIAAAMQSGISGPQAQANFCLALYNTAEFRYLQ